MYDMYVILPERAYAWKQEVTGFIENYEFPSTAFPRVFRYKTKTHYSFKETYSISNVGLVP